MLRFAKLLAQWIGLLATVAIALELTVRVDDWSQFGVPLDEPAISLDDLVVRDSVGLHARPGAHFRQFRINALGFRGPDAKVEPLRRPVVIASGASETFGLYEAPGREWPRQLEDSLRVCAPHIVVHNAAFAGMSLPTVEQDFQLRLKSLSPQVIVYYPTPMQYLSTLPLQAAAPFRGQTEGLSPFRSRALPRFRDAFKRALPEPVLVALRGILVERERSERGLKPKHAVEPERLALFESDLRRLIGTYRASGVHPVIVVHANRFSEFESRESQVWLKAWERFYPGYTGEAIAQFDAIAAERIRAVGADSSVTVVDTRNALRKAGSEAFADFSHLTSRGAALVGGQVASVIRPIVCQGS